jgi:hypothetical protein
MSDEETMTINERRKYLRRMQKRYRKASRGEKGRLPNSMKGVDAPVGFLFDLTHGIALENESGPLSSNSSPV